MAKAIPSRVTIILLTHCLIALSDGSARFVGETNDLRNSRVDSITEVDDQAVEQGTNTEGRILNGETSSSRKEADDQAVEQGINTGVKGKGRVLNRKTSSSSNFGSSASTISVVVNCNFK